MGVTRTIWEILWDYDPNALVVADHNLTIRIVNPAFRKLFNMADDEKIIGRNLKDIFDEVSFFTRIRDNEEIIKNLIVRFPKYDVDARLVGFPVPETGLIAAIMIDLSPEIDREIKLREMKIQAAEQVQAVVDKQMQIAQEIASILGETVAETKSQMLKLKNILTLE